MLIHSKLKSLSFILQNTSKSRSVLAKIQAIKQVNCHIFQPFTPFNMFVFKKRSCILHHFTFLFGAKLVVFSPPKTCIQPLKYHILTGILPFWAMFLMVLTGMFIPIAVNYYAFHLAFLSILHCIQHHFTLRLASKRTAFSTKMHCVLHQNALRLAPKCTAFCGILHYMLL